MVVTPLGYPSISVIARSLVLHTVKDGNLTLFVILSRTKNPKVRSTVSGELESGLTLPSY